MDQTFMALVANIGNALKLKPPDYFRSIFGNRSSWRRSQTPSTELGVIKRKGLLTGVATVAHVTFPAFPGRPSWVPEHNLGLFRESRALPYPRIAEPVNAFPKESWLFINGMCTDEAVLDLNAEYLHRLFRRPLTLLHNQTNGFVLDLLECAFGKGWLLETESVRALFPAFYAELKRSDVDRVVLIGHSQGTILAAVFVAMLRRLLVDHPVSKAAGTAPEDLLAERMLSGGRRKKAARRLHVGAGPDNVQMPEVAATAAPPLGDVAAWFDWQPGVELGLPPLAAAELKKLEIYSFATCATDMRSIATAAGAAPYVEHFGNTRDIVARLGMFAPSDGPGRTQIEGVRFVREGGWGHLLNAHYLDPLEHQWSGGEIPGGGFAGLPPDQGRESRLAPAFRQARGLDTR